MHMCIVHTRLSLLFANFSQWADFCFANRTCALCIAFQWIICWCCAIFLRNVEVLSTLSIDRFVHQFCSRSHRHEKSTLLPIFAAHSIQITVMQNSFVHSTIWLSFQFPAFSPATKTVQLFFFLLFTKQMHNGTLKLNGKCKYWF